MALTIEQKPLYTLNPVGQEVIFAALDSTVVSTYYNVRYTAQVHISTVDIDLATTTALVGTFKTSPNNAGVGMFDFRPIIESFVSPDNLAAVGSEYKGTATTSTLTHPLHLVDKFSLNDNSLRYLKIKFTIEGSTTAGGTVALVDTEDSTQYTLINGYLKYTDELTVTSGNFGYSTSKFQFDTSIGAYLSNAPTTQNANDADYGTISFFNNPINTESAVTYIKLGYFSSGGFQLSSDTVDLDLANGAYDTYNTDTPKQLLHFGCFPGNLMNWSTNFIANNVNNSVAAITVRAYNTDDDQIGQTITININCPTLKGFEPIRLTWLNQWGAWDYYTFNMKSIKKLSTKGNTYEQLAGTWNESKYIPDGYKGGKKAFRVNATEKITMNTDFVSEAESEWFEELINSPEVYILQNYKAESSSLMLNQYVTPVRLTTSSYTKKTIANDKLMQYTFEVEKSKTLRTQSV